MRSRHALVASTLLLLAGCPPPAEEFPQAFLEAWCEAYQQECTTDLTFASCRATGRPVDLEPPLPTDCVYRRGRAGPCLDTSRWTCELDDEGARRILVPPPACARVYECD